MQWIIADRGSNRCASIRLNTTISNSVNEIIANVRHPHGQDGVKGGKSSYTSLVLPTSRSVHGIRPHGSRQPAVQDADRQHAVYQAHPFLPWHYPQLGRIEEFKPSSQTALALDCTAGLVSADSPNDLSRGMLSPKFHELRSAPYIRS